MKKLGWNPKRLRTKILLDDHRICHAWISRMQKSGRPLMEKETGGAWLPDEVKARHDAIVTELKRRVKDFKHHTIIIFTPQLRELQNRYKSDLRDERISSWFELNRRIKREAQSRQIVQGKGKKNRPDYLIVGQSPGYEEFREGEPFVGRAGRILQIVLNDLHISRDQVYITNALKFIDKVDSPTLKEVKEQQKYLQAEIDLVRPKKVMALGYYAIQSLSGLRIGYTPAPHPSMFRFIGGKVVELIKKAFRR